MNMKMFLKDKIYKRVEKQDDVNSCVRKIRTKNISNPYSMLLKNF